ncbi:DUF6207 family protein [Streptomyces griseorubiginosus]|uniref:DUF6207 family protein n=1 Tax=Streptomyces griseorubiginosus TaxID=67304 RepID=UPI0036548E7E
MGRRRGGGRPAPPPAPLQDAVAALGAAATADRVARDQGRPGQLRCYLDLRQ